MRRKQEIYLAGVLGSPIGHSLSPTIFACLAEKQKLPLLYRAIDTKPHDLPRAFWMGEILGFSGFNVTIPIKESVMKHLDVVSEEARSVGAVNVVHREKDRWVGHNTDVEGILRVFKKHEVPVRGCRAVLYGAGGAARAAAFALGKLGAKEVFLFNRTRLRAKRLCGEFSRLFPGTKYLVGESDKSALLYINATPLGMKGYSGTPHLPPARGGTGFAFDLVYRPEKTPFLAAAEKKGLIPLSGLEMLVYQALATWRIWFGRLPNEEKLAPSLARYLREILK